VGGSKRYVANSFFTSFYALPAPCPYALGATSPLSRVTSLQPNFERRAVSEVCHLIFSVLEDAAQGAVCATSRRNNLVIAREHRTSCVALHRRHTPSVSRHCRQAPRRVTLQMPVCVCVFGCTTGFALTRVLGSPQCCATLRRAMWQTSPISCAHTEISTIGNFAD
jgi:hypothetical protein